MKILWIFFGDYHKIGLFLVVISMNFSVFSECQDTDWRIFLGLLKFVAQILNIYLVCLKFLIFFGG